MSILKSFIATMGVSPVVSLASAGDVTDQEFFPSSSTAYIELQNDGDIFGFGSIQGSGDQGDWITPRSAAGGNYEARWTNTSGTLSSGTAGTWEALSTTRQWAVSRVGVGSKTCTGTLEIRRTAGGAVLDSTNVTLTAEVV
jgi:hypothetical protein